MNARWWRAAIASPAALLPWVLVGISAAGALFGAWWITGTQAAVVSLTARWPWLLIGASAALVLSVFVWWLWWQLPKRQVARLRHAIRDPKARADVEDNFRKTIGQLLGGAAVLIGAAFAYLQFQQQQTSAHDLLISNQVSKGFELLGNKDGNIEQRLGGIYALEGVMNTSKQYHQSVLEALCAFVRDSTINKTGDGPPAADVQAALTVIGRRKTEDERFLWKTINLAGVYIPKANLNSAKLSNAELDHAVLTGAELDNAQLQHADLFGANLGGVQLTFTNLSGATLIDARLNGAQMRGANMTGAVLVHADMTGANLIGDVIINGALYAISAQGLTQAQLDEACGEGVKGADELEPPLTFHPRPCPAETTRR